MNRLLICLFAFTISASTVRAQGVNPGPYVSLGKIRGTTTTVEELRNNRRLEVNNSVQSVEEFEVSLLFTKKNGEDRYFGPFKIKWSQNLPDNIYALIDEHPTELKKIFIEGIRIRDSGGTLRLCKEIILTCSK